MSVSGALRELLCLEPIVSDLDAWFKELDRFAEVPFMEDGRRLPPKPEAEESIRLTYLLDTNVVIALLRNKPATVGGSDTRCRRAV